MKKIFLFAVAAALFAACSSNDSTNDGQESQQTLESGSIGFDAYTQRSITRSGQSGIMDLTQLQTSGFGVFGYYTDNNEYEQSRIPDFMYNQKVEWDGVSYWKYEPIKYWPNEYGNSANSDDNDKVSFFAYAPYVEVQPNLGKVVKVNSNDDQWGITALSRNSVSGDPLVKYIASFEAAKRVDLMWGVCDDPNWAIVQGGTVQQLNDGKTGLPWLNVERPMEAKTQQTADQRLKFTFKHALAQFSVNIDAFVDGLNANNPLADKTKIYVRQISFTGFALKGALNLNNTDPNKALWLDYNGTADIESGAAVTIYDGRKDGKEGTAGADASNEKARGLNPDIISNFNDALIKGNTTEGVTNVTKPLFESNSPVMVIPTGEDMEVEIVYDVETEDENLSTSLSDGKTKGSSIENRITKTVSFGADGMQNGKHYTLNLHLGMNSVKFDAEVSPWQEATDKPEADLPLNMPSFLASNTPVEQEVVLTSDNQKYMFAVYGLTPGEAVTASFASTPAVGSVLDGKTLNVASVGDFTGSTLGSGVVNSSGIAYVKINESIVNNTVKNIAKSSYISVKGATSNKEVRISFEQIAHKLGLGVSSLTGEDVINLTSTASGTVWSAEAITYTVTKNSVPVTTGTFTPAASAGSAVGTFQLPANVTAGDVYAITLQAGDAPAETWNVNIAGISFVPATRTETYRFATAYTYPAMAYKYVRNELPTVGWTATTTNGVATINTTDGTVSTLKSGTENFKATVDAADINDTDNGWYFTNATKEASYTLTVNKQASAPDAFTTVTNVTGQAVAVNSPVSGVAFNATFKGAIDASEAADGAVAYQVIDVKIGTTPQPTNTFVITGGTGLEVGPTALTASTTYTVTVAATMTAGNKYAAYTNTDHTITFDITTAP